MGREFNIIHLGTSAPRHLGTSAAKHRGTWQRPGIVQGGILCPDVRCRPARPGFRCRQPRRRRCAIDRDTARVRLAATTPR